MAACCSLTLRFSAGFDGFHKGFDTGGARRTAVHLTSLLVQNVFSCIALVVPDSLELEIK